MAAIQPQDLVYTYIKLNAKVNVYETPENGDNGSPVWFQKQTGEVTGRLFSWVDTSPATGQKYKSLYLMFKSNDNFDTNSKAYFVKFEPKIIDWNFTKQQLIEKGQADMSFFGKFVDDMENLAIDYGNNLIDYAQSGLKWGLILGGIVLLFGTVIIPYTKYRVYKGAARDLIKEAKRV